jgi:HK97 family phage prohead protease
MEYKSTAGAFVASASKSDDGRDDVIRGYMSVWGGPDQGGDIVYPGAFDETLKRKKTIPLLWQHQTDEPIGKVFMMHPDSHGLFFKARVGDTRRGKDALALVNAGLWEGGVSYGYDAVGAVRSRRTGLRDLKQIDLYEASLVTFPMCSDARLLTDDTADLLTIGEAKALRAMGAILTPREWLEYVAAERRQLERMSYGGFTFDEYTRRELAVLGRELRELR